jgi:hypothetical protein
VIDQQKILYGVVEAPFDIIGEITSREFAFGPVRGNAVAANTLFSTGTRAIAIFLVSFFFTFHNLQIYFDRNFAKIKKAPQNVEPSEMNIFLVNTA